MFQYVVFTDFISYLFAELFMVATTIITLYSVQNSTINIIFSWFVIDKQESIIAGITKINIHSVRVTFDETLSFRRKCLKTCAVISWDRTDRRLVELQEM